MEKEVLYIVDLDNTLIDTDALKRDIESKFNNLVGSNNKIDFWKFYEEARTKYELIKISDITLRLSKKLSLKRSEIKNIFYNHNFKKYLYPQSIILLRKLKKLGKVVILSLGEKKYHETKIKKSGLEKIVGTNNILLVSDKLKAFQKITSNKFKKYRKIILIDDRSDMLENISSIRHGITTVWIRHGKYKNRLPLKDTSITFNLKSISQAKQILESYIDTLLESPSNRQWSIMQGITLANINDLIKYTREDKKIVKFTHDKKRFGSKELFDSWIKGRKIIFTLVDNNQKLAGLIWFSKKRMQVNCKTDYDYTFAIRLYPPARGKKLSYQFMKIALNSLHKDFPKIKKLWLSTKVNNTPALSLYNKFGFREAFLSQEKIYMTLDF